MKSKPVIIEYPKNVSSDNPTTVGFLKGSTFEVPTPTMAKKHHPDARIVRYADGEDYEEPKPSTARKPSKKKKSTSTRSTRRIAAAPTTPVVTPPEAAPDTETVTTATPETAASTEMPQEGP